MKGFIVYPTYKIEGNKAYIYLFGRLENGESFLTINYFRPYFYIKESDLQKAKGLVNFESEKTELTDLDNNSVVKIILNIPKEVPDARKMFETHRIACYEADIRFAYRFLIDKDIKGSMEIEGNFEKGELIDRIYNEPSLSAAEFIPKLKTLSMDIETDKNGKQLYCISMVMDDYERVLLVSDKNVPKADSFPDEKSLLEEFRKRILELDPDIITGWNLIDFDLMIIQKKFHDYKIPFDLGRIGWKSSLRLESNFILDSKADFPGRQVLDGIQLLKTNFVKLQDYKLDTAAKTLLGESKSIGEKNKGDDIEEAYKKNQPLLVEYNLKDSQLVLKILKKTGVVDLTIQRSLLTGMQLDKVRASVASFDSVYLRELHKVGKVGFSVGNVDREERIKGGYVMESKPGLYDYVLVFDFKSLYPSIIRTFNIDPISFVRHDEKVENAIVAPNGAKFRNAEGLLPSIIEHLWQQRDVAKRRKNEIASWAIKTVMNSFWGVLANPTCRFYNLDMANAITGFARSMIMIAGDKARSLGQEVIYSDTDSLFVNSKVSSYEEAEKLGNEIQSKINRFFTEFVERDYKRKNFMELQFEKIFIKFFMPTIRNTEIGSKKRYAGIVLKDGKEKLIFTGLESVRRDWTEVAKKFQNELLHKIFHNDDYALYIRDFVKELRDGKYDEMLVYRRALTKGLHEYTKTTPPHVKAARQLTNIKSNIIEYVMTENGPEPLELQKSKIDYEHYIDKQIKPLADSVLSPLNTNFDDILNKNKQKNLFEY